MSYNSFVYDLSQQIDDRVVQCVCIKTVPASPIRGDEEYYKWRFENFMERHKDCSHKPPQYYYGTLSKNKVECNESIYPAVTDFSALLTKQYSLLTYRFFENAIIGLGKEIAKRQKQAAAYTQKDISYTPVLDDSYGYKYCVAFGKLLKPYMSADGKKWVDQTLDYLQQFMEEGVVKLSWLSPKFNKEFNDKYNLDKGYAKTKFYTDIELNNSRFKTFAFATHPDAYLLGGLASLLVKKGHFGDLMMIVLTPELKEWRDSETWLQAWITAKGIWKELDIGSWFK